MAQGRGNALVAWNHVVGSMNLMLVATVVIAVMVQSTQGAVHVVGGSNKWADPAQANLNSSYLLTWASTQTFAVGDTLLFEYQQGAHDVLEVTAANYNACNSALPINSWTTGNDTVLLNTTETFYFICGVPGHCSPGGQKVAISVTGPASSPSSSSSSPSSPSPTSQTPPSSKPNGSSVSALPASAITVVFGALFVACVSLL